MATVPENIATIAAKAAELDTLVTQFRDAKVVIDAAEYELRHAGVFVDKAGRQRLADYGHSLMVKPSIVGDKTVAELASEAWLGVS